MSASPDVRLQSYPCAICNGTDTLLVFRKRGVTIEQPFQIVKCRTCDHHYVDPRICDEDIASIYDDAYYAGRGFDRTANFLALPDEAGNRRLSLIADMMAKAADRPLRGLTWLDYGCGPGHLLAAVTSRGVRASGYDFGETARAACTRKGLEVLDDGVLAERAGTFDVVSASEVIEHVGDPRGFLRSLVSLLRVGGVLFVQTGNWNLIRHVPGRPYVMPEGHLHYFTPNTMRRLFATSGLREVDVVNVSWAGYKALTRLPFGGARAARVVERAVRFVAPGYAQFPIGIRVA